MSRQVDVSDIFGAVMTHALDHVAAVHGEQAAHNLFFELYDHTFSHLEREFGFGAVVKFWQSIADSQLGALEHLIREKGFKGMEEYWRATLGQEGADYEIKAGDESFELIVKRCPPTEWFKSRGIDKYPRYCEHCPTLYGRVGSRCGFDLEYTPRDPETGAPCRFRFTRHENV